MPNWATVFATNLKFQENCNFLPYEHDYFRPNMKNIM